ncbi:zinc finger CCCH domain-containing protein 53-like isoform X2 [Wolffia australiana]
MDAYEATRIVLSRIQSLDPDNASKIMGLLLIQDHGEKEMIRLAFGPEALLQTVVLKARKELGLLPSSTPSTPSSAPSSPFLLSRQNSSSRLHSPSSWAAPFSQSAEDVLVSPNLHDQFSNGEVFYPDNGEAVIFPYGGLNWGVNGAPRRSGSAAENGGEMGWRPCLYFARGFCKNGSTCRFLHGSTEDSAVEQQFQELLLRSKSPRFMAASFPYSPSPSSPSSGKCLGFLQQQNESQRVAAAALGGEEPLKFGRSRLERANDYAGQVNPGSRQIYLTFPADSTFREEDVANYFSIYGPVQDVRIPYQQKRMFGFVTFVYPETVKLILAKGNPHFVCDARVLVKPYKEKGKVPEKYRKLQQQQPQQIAERGGVFSGCTTPTGLDSKDPFDLQLLGATMLYNSGQEALMRKKMEELQHAAELQHAIELQRRRLIGMQLDLKARSLSSPAVPVSTPLPSPGPINTYAAAAAAAGEEPPPPEAEKMNAHAFRAQAAVSDSDKEDLARDAHHGDTGQSGDEHNLPDSPFASPTKCSFEGSVFAANCEAVAAEVSPVARSPNNNGHLLTSTLDMASFNSCFFPVSRFSSGHGAVGM